MREVRVCPSCEYEITFASITSCPRCGFNLERASNETYLAEQRKLVEEIEATEQRDQDLAPTPPETREKFFDPYSIAGLTGAISGFLAAPLGWMPVGILKQFLAPVLGDWVWGKAAPLGDLVCGLPIIGAIFGLFGGLIGVMVYRRKAVAVKPSRQFITALLCGAVCGLLANFIITPMTG